MDARASSSGGKRLKTGPVEIDVTAELCQSAAPERVIKRGFLNRPRAPDQSRSNICNFIRLDGVTARAPLDSTIITNDFSVFRLSSFATGIFKCFILK